MAPIYDSFAKYYDLAFIPIERLFLAKMRSKAFAYLPTDGSILEVGAGTGANFNLYDPAQRTTAIEISSEMIEVARPKSDVVNIVQADAQALPFAADTFDAAVATLVFCSVPDPIAGLREIRRVVRHNGRVVLLEHVRPPAFLGRVFDGLDRFTFSWFEDHFNRETAATAEASGLTVKSVERRLFNIMNIIVCEVQREVSAKPLPLK